MKSHKLRNKMRKIWKKIFFQPIGVMGYYFVNRPINYIVIFFI